MGLDMYLTAKRYVKNWEHKLSKNEVTLKTDGVVFTTKMPVKEISYEAAYWRKANEIHQWLVDNVQDGEDNCEEYWVSPEKLQELVDIVNKVLDSTELIDGDIVNGYTYKDGVQTPNIEKGKVLKDDTVAKELLPTTSGFFFGGTNYDEYYWNDLLETKQQLEAALETTDGFDYYYQSSW